MDRGHEIVDATVQHIGITVVAVLLGLRDRVPAGAARAPARPAGVAASSAFTTGIYTVPSLALFPLLVPFTGLSATTVVIGLGALRPHHPGPQPARGTAARCPTTCASPRPASATAARGLLAPDRAAARPAGRDGRPAGRDRVDGRADDGGLAGGVRRPRQPHQGRRAAPTSGPSSSPRRSVRAAGAWSPRRAARCCCNACSPRWTPGRAGMNVLAETWAYLLDADQLDRRRTGSSR